MSDSLEHSLVGTQMSREAAKVFPVMPALFREAGEQAWYRLLDFLCSTIRNRNTREAYARAIERFCRWCDMRGLQLQHINSLAIATYIEERCPDVCNVVATRRPLSDPSIKQHLSAIKMLFDHLVTGHIVAVNPAAAVRGPRHIVLKGKTPVLGGSAAARLLDSIPTNTIVGLRDRALIGTMIYSFARISAVLRMNTEDYHSDAGGRTMWLSLKEKAGKHHEVPVHRSAKAYLDSYLAAAGIAEDRHGPLFRSIGRRGQLSTRPLDRRDAWAMIKRRSRQAGLSSAICCHTFRATGITCYLNSGAAIPGRAKCVLIPWQNGSYHG